MFSTGPFFGFPLLDTATWWVTVPFSARGFASTVDITNSVNRWFRRSSSLTENGLWLFIFLAILLLWAGLYFWDRARKAGQRARTDREGLFIQLCDLHKLSKADRQLLRKAAKSQNLQQPGIAFVNPQVLLRYMESCPQARPEARKLLDRLFGESLVEEIVRTAPAAVPVASS